MLVLTDRKELEDRRFCKLGVESRRSSLRETVLGVLRGAGALEGTGVTEEEACRAREGAREGVLSGGALGDRVGDEAGSGVPLAVARERRLKLSESSVAALRGRRSSGERGA